MIQIASPHRLSSQTTPTEQRQSTIRQSLEADIEKAAVYLPNQGPITSFVHQNVIPALEDRPFEQAVQEAADLYHCESWLSETKYHQALASGRIRQTELEQILRDDLQQHAGHPVAGAISRFDLQWAMLQTQMPRGSEAELQWLVANRDDRSLQKIWGVCRDHLNEIQASMTPVANRKSAPRHRDMLLAACGEDSDRLVHELLIPFCAAFLDQGVAHWTLPDRDQGLFKCFCRLHSQAGGFYEPWMQGLASQLQQLLQADTPAIESLQDSLQQLGVADEHREAYLRSTLLALKGWCGMIRQIVRRPHQVVHPIAQDSLLQFLAIRLLLDQHAVRYLAERELGYTGSVHADAFGTWMRNHSESVDRTDSVATAQQALAMALLAEHFGWDANRLAAFQPDQWISWSEEVQLFSESHRRRLYQRAYEQRFRVQALDAFSLKRLPQTESLADRPSSPSDRAATTVPEFQAVFCIDDREESIRRHLEEIAPLCVTFGTAGFFNVPMFFKGAGEARFQSLCPLAITPSHWVVEEVGVSLEATYRRQTDRRRAVGKATQLCHVGSRTAAAGTLMSAGLGVLASVPLVTRILFPRFTAWFRKTAFALATPPLATRLRLERLQDPPGPDGDHVGFSVDEMAEMAAQMLGNMGVTQQFSKLVVLVGHGSTSLNNPHLSAYGCGACCGGSGGPNARAMAQMLNDYRVRTRLRQKGIDLPEETRFLAGVHNTCKDTVVFYDLEQLPYSHIRQWERVRDSFAQACERNAHERCRRFETASLRWDPAEARQHVEQRSEDLAQTLPELGHVTSSLTIVGRRQRTRALFLDRRAFLSCYDPTEDDEEGTILGNVLRAGAPVSIGINLSYFFSHTDPVGYGCGTKLPHNVTSMVGVMDGAASDLRTGLPVQMTELHEPVRMLFVVETSAAVMTKVLQREQAIGRLVQNQWCFLAILDPDSQQMQIYKDGQFQDYHPQATMLPVCSSSATWYHGLRKPLDFAVIGQPDGSDDRIHRCECETVGSDRC